MESASNAGWFGRGSFTDHSNLDVVPALLVGLMLAAFRFAWKMRAALWNRDEPSQNLLRASGTALGAGVARLLPGIFILQIAAVYGMETVEQYVVWGHVLGGSIWLGGPVVASLTLHAVICCAVAFAATRMVRVLAEATLRVVSMIRALSAAWALPAPPILQRRYRVAPFNRSLFALSCMRERAPPLLKV